jgi:D-beta-D-heptose 7-phosphate kinase/D-beta-D-heptose 1-phosphate adenosyltransferase
MVSSASKIQSLENLARIALMARKSGKKVVTTNGCFDLFHVGHVRNLKAAKSLGELLIVGVNSDSSVRSNKGPKRPIISAIHRAEIIAELSFVDYVFIFSSKRPYPWIKKIKPDIHVKGEGSEKSPAYIFEKSVVEKGGGKVTLAPHIPGHSTTIIIERILKRYL